MCSLKEDKIIAWPLRTKLVLGPLDSFVSTFEKTLLESMSVWTERYLETPTLTSKID